MVTTCRDWRQTRKIVFEFSAIKPSSFVAAPTSSRYPASKCVFTKGSHRIDKDRRNQRGRAKIDTHPSELRVFRVRYKAKNRSLLEYTYTINSMAPEKYYQSWQVWNVTLTWELLLYIVTPAYLRKNMPQPQAENEIIRSKRPQKVNTVGYCRQKFVKSCVSIYSGFVAYSFVPTL